MLAGPITNPQEALVPAYVRADGGVRLRFGAISGQTHRLVAHESGGYRARFPATFNTSCEAVLINTGGGMAGGDRMQVEAELDSGADATITTQAAEKIYRSQGPMTNVGTRLVLGSGARLVWLPQETILFSGARLMRQLDVDMADDASLIACESLYFGRTAMEESLQAGLLRDRWRIRRGGRLAFADDVRLEGLINQQLAQKAVADGGHAVATIVCIQPDAERGLDRVRALLPEAPCPCGVTALPGMLVARAVAGDAADLRRFIVTIITYLTGRALPRVWTT